MSRLIRYCTYVIDRYNALPAVLIIVVKVFSSISFEEQFTVNINHMHLLEMKCQCWTISCNIISAKSMKVHLNKNPMDSLVALAYYMTCQSQSLESLTFNTDPTVKLLYAITNKVVTKGDANIKKTVMMKTLNQNYKN